jgi:hypothetical protein
MQFQIQLENEIWESVYTVNDTNNKFNSFLCTFLNIFEVSFLIKYKSIHRNKNGLIKQEIKCHANAGGGCARMHRAGTVMLQ